MTTSRRFIKHYLGGSIIYCATSKFYHWEKSSVADPLAYDRDINILEMKVKNKLDIT